MGRGDHPETYLLKALCCQSAPSWLKVRWWVGGGWPWGLYCHLLELGVGVLSISHSHFPIPNSQFPSLVPNPRPRPSPSRLTIIPQDNLRRRSVGPPSVQAIGWSLRFSSGGSKEIRQNLDNAKTVKTNTRTKKSCQKRLKSAKSCDYIEPL